MPSLTIPEAGLSLQSPHDPRSKNGAAVPSAFALTLTDEHLENMIRCYQNGQPVQLSLGERPSLQVGSKSQTLYQFDDPFTHELYQTPTSTIFESATMVPPISAAMKYMFGGKGLASIPPKARVEKIKVGASQTSKGASTPLRESYLASATTGADDAVAQLQSSLASEKARKEENTTKYIKDGAGLPGPGRRTGIPAKLVNKSKLLGKNNRSLVNDTTRSMPSSPALSGVGSPSLGPTSVPISEQQADKLKSMRKPVVHLLAISPMTQRELLDRINDMSEEDTRVVTYKVGDLNETTGKYELKKIFWKDLDIWSFDYDNEEERQSAIDNAVKMYDKARITTSEPVWERLLPKAERGTGKCLSKLQAQIATGQAQRAPKIKVLEAEGSSPETPGADEAARVGEKTVPKAKGEAMSRSISNPPTVKSKKVSEKEAQAKRLFSKNLKPTAKPPATKSEKKNNPGNQPLSSKFVSDSDEEDDYYMIPPKQTTQPEQVNGKRSREEDVDTSDSSIPLSKKVKKDVPAHRVSDASQSSRVTSSSTNSLKSNKSKGTSPQKSSPLASSPPTNASEFENSSGRTSSSSSPAQPILNIKGTRSPIHKRKHQKTSSDASAGSSTTSSTTSQRRLTDEVLSLAMKYKRYYPAYEKLYQELADMLKAKRRVRDEKLAELNDMQVRLEDWKKTIVAGVEEF